MPQTFYHLMPIKEYGAFRDCQMRNVNQSSTFSLPHLNIKFLYPLLIWAIFHSFPPNVYSQEPGPETIVNLAEKGGILFLENPMRLPLNERTPNVTYARDPLTGEYLEDQPLWTWVIFSDGSIMVDDGSGELFNRMNIEAIDNQERFLTFTIAAGTEVIPTGVYSIESSESDQAGGYFIELLGESLDLDTYMAGYFKSLGGSTAEISIDPFEETPYTEVNFEELGNEVQLVEFFTEGNGILIIPQRDTSEDFQMVLSQVNSFQPHTLGDLFFFLQSHETGEVPDTTILEAIDPNLVTAVGNLSERERTILEGVLNGRIRKNENSSSIAR